MEFDDVDGGFKVKVWTLPPRSRHGATANVMGVMNLYMVDHVDMTT